MAIWRGVGGSGESTNDSTVPTVTELLVDAEAARDAAAASASSAASSASSASSSASTASTQASNASTSATNAANSASSASTSASNAASSASSASTSASTATTKASEAATSATNAANSATSAASSATTATTKASEASTSATNAASSASSAASSASTATTQASNASTSASNAASSASSAAASAASAAASFDAFDDIYLGAKSTNPTVDNDGDPLSIGDQYFNTVANELRIWNGSSWQAASTVGGTITSLNVTGNTTLGDASSDTVTINGTVQPGVIVSGSSSSDALRITQTGTGNALLVEDAANPDATPFVIDTDGNAVFGSASTFNVISPQTGTAASTRLQYTTTSGANNSTFAIANWSTSGTSVSGAIVFAKSKSGTVGSQTSGIVASGDRLGLLDFQGSDGTSFVRAARIGAEVDGTPGTGDMPGRLVFSTTADGASAPTERMRLDSSGNLGLGVTPSAWSGVTASQVKGIALWEVAANNSHFSSNLYYNGTNRIYIASGYATEYAQQSGAHYWATAASGTAGGTVSLTTAMTLDASGNLGVGTTSPSVPLHVQANASGYALILKGRSAGGNEGWLQWTNNAGTVQAGIYSTSDNLVFANTSSNTERMRVASTGELLIGTTTTAMTAGGIKLRNAGGNLGEITLANNSGASDYVARFVWGSTPTLVGNITVSSTATAYNTSSDYRLKEAIQPMTGALAKVQALKPVTYKWKIDGSDGEGFIAHELAEVVPQCVTGEKDAVDEDGNPKYQGIDTSFLVATLTAALQEAVAKIEQLKARLDAANL